MYMLTFMFFHFLSTIFLIKNYFISETLILCLKLYVKFDIEKPNVMNRRFHHMEVYCRIPIKYT